MKRFLLMGSLLAFAACDDGDSTSPAPAPAPAPAPEPEPPPETASYTWAVPEIRISPRVPGSLPDGVGTAPPLAMVAHSADLELFAEGAIASDGLKRLAEAGDSSVFLAEAEAMGAEVLFDHQDDLLAFVLTGGATTELHIDRPCVTYAQMFSPSPDWFFGAASLCFVDETGNWVEETMAELIAYDAGTREGTEFRKGMDPDTEPREPISLLDVPPYFVPPAIVQILTLTRVAE